MKKNKLLFLVTILVYLFLIGPLVVIMAASFSDTNYLKFPGEGFTLRWYQQVFTMSAFAKAARLSLFIALGGTAIALLFGLPAAYALNRYDFKGKNTIKTIFLSPVLIPCIVLGFIMLRYVVNQYDLAVIPSLLIGHTLLSIPYIMRVITSSLANFDFAVEEAACSLGATRQYTFFHIVLPNIKSGIASACIMAVINSFNNVSLSAFLTGPGVNMLPIEIMGYVEYHFDPTIAALATIMMVATLGVMLLRYERGNGGEDFLSLRTSLALHATPLLREGEENIAQAWSAELEQKPDDSADETGDAQDSEGTVLTQEETPDEIAVTENGSPARTLKASDPSGYTVFGNVYINNGSDAALDASMLAGDYAAKLGAEGPQVLIIHTHGSESYTMPPGQEYDVSDTFRTLDTNCNMIRIGDEMAQVLTDAGISVVHDRSLYDYPSYSGAYNRSLASIESYLQKYPSISFVLDVHRDAVQDANGQQFKLLCGEDKNAAQLEFVIGSNGGGLSHDLWRENLKLACAVQETLYKDYPTLMRPVTVRNSRYNQHMTTGSLLVEVGTAGNSLEEAVNAARLFAAGFAKTIQNGT